MEPFQSQKTNSGQPLHISNVRKSQNKNIFLHYSVIVESLQKGLPPKYLSFEEKEVMRTREGPYWYDNWDYH